MIILFGFKKNLAINWIFLWFEKKKTITNRFCIFVLKSLKIKTKIGNDIK
jgi:hypothetical protein